MSNTVGLAAYEHLGDPDAPAPPTKKQERAQRERLAMREWAREQAAAAPPLRPEQVAELRRILGPIRERRDQELMVWRLRLYCGHVLERKAHHTHKTVHAAFTGSSTCPQCGLDPATILAARPLGLAGPPPRPAKKPAPDRARLQQRAERLEQEAAALRKQLATLDET